MTKLIWKDVEWRTKTANTVPTVFEQKFAFKSFRLHFWENNWLTSNSNNQMIGKDVEWKAKRANIVPTVFEQKFAFESFGLHFWENDWLTTNNNNQLIVKDVKMVKEKQKTANTVPTVFAQKFAFESPDLHFWENNWFTTNNNDQIDWEKQVFCVKEPFFHITFEGRCPKKHSKSPTNHFLLQLEQVWCKSFLLCFCCSSFSQ